jgi:hypothetical protein
MSAEITSGTQMNAQTHSSARVRGTPLFLLRGAWIIAVTLYAVVSLLGIPFLVQQYESLTGVALQMGFGEWSSAGLRAALEALGISVRFYGVLSLAVMTVVVFGFVGLGALLFWKRSDERIGLFTSFFLVTFGLVSSNSFSALTNAYPAAKGWLWLLLGLPWIMFYVFFYIFPDGRFVPRWTALLALFLLISIFMVSFAETPPQFYGAFLVVAFSSAVFAQVYRFVRVSNPLQRAQTKWVLFAIVVLALGEMVGQGVLRQVFPQFVVEGPTRLVYELWINVGVLGFLILPVALTIAIMRYRLFNIDVIIRKTLVYSILTGLLALIYFGGVILLQQLTRSITASSDLAIAVSTLMLAALFFPLRRRVQNTIDRRFYRRKYDAAKTLAAFSATVRDEVELEKLTAELLNVVNETMQPASVSLWLKGTADEKPKRSST